MTDLKSLFFQKSIAKTGCLAGSPFCIQSTGSTLALCVQIILLQGLYVSQHGTGIADFERIGWAIILSAGLAKYFLDFAILDQH